MGNLSTAIKNAHALEAQINSVLVNREAEAHTATLALLSGQHHLQVGPPGTAKSLLANTLHQSIEGVEVFDTLLSRTTEPDEIFGPVSFKGMEEDDYRRASDGFAPDAHIWFLDEFFKAGDALLNNFLTAMNERTYRNGKTQHNLPLISLFAGSNELYDTEALHALYSRFTFRHWVDYLNDRELFDIMMGRALNGVKVSPVVSLDDILKCQAGLADVHINKDTLDALWEVKTALGQAGFTIDDRKMVWLITKVIRAEAVFNGCEETTPEHLFILQHCLWDNPEDRNQIRQIVLSIVNPTAEECAKYIDSSLKVFAQCEKAIADANGDTRSAMSEAIDASSEVAEILQTLERRINETSNGSKVELAQCKEKVEHTQKKILAHMGAGLGIDLGV